MPSSDGGRRLVAMLAAGAVVVSAALVGWVAVTLPHGGPGKGRGPVLVTSERNHDSGGMTPTPASSPPTSLTEELARLAATPLVPAAKNHGIEGEALTQPDLYAAEFVRGLLTQDYAEPREAKLAWVQAESTTTNEPLVVGLVPEGLRSRIAVFSVTDDATGDAPIPTAAVWEDLRAKHAHTTVRIDQVSEPPAWSNAVSAGRITDPGITAREVAATVTLHSDTGTRQRSVALTIHLDGPPTQARWKFVTVVDHRSMPMGES